mgnify:FL=1
MTVYEQRATVTAAAGAASSIGLNIPGGLIRQVLIRANTDTTVFRANLTDASGLRRRDYGFHTGEINDPGMNQTLSLAVAGSLAINITNASPNDTFSILVSVQER